MHPFLGESSCCCRCPSNPAAAEKAILGEALSPVDQGMAFGYFSIAWGIGALAGPLIGGVFALPCNTLLSGTALCAEGSLLQRR